MALGGLYVYYNYVLYIIILCQSCSQYSCDKLLNSINLAVTVTKDTDNNQGGTSRGARGEIGNWLPPTTFKWGGATLLHFCTVTLYTNTAWGLRMHLRAPILIKSCKISGLKDTIVVNQSS